MSGAERRDGTEYSPWGAGPRTMQSVNKTANNYLPVVAVAIAYYGAARLGLMLAYPGTNASPLWLATGIALSAILLRGNRMWPGVALGAFIANFQQLAGLGLSIPASLAASLSTSTGNTLEALFGAYLIQRYTGTRYPFGRSVDVLSFIAFGALVSTTVSATIGTATICLSLSAWSNVVSIWLTWWLGDAAGAIVVVPLLMTLHRVDISGWKGQPMAGNMLLWAAIGGICLGIFSGDRPIFFLLFPLLIIAAFRLGQFGSAAAVGIISIVSTYVTVNGSGPFSAETMHEALLLQQGFIGSIASASMVLAAVVSEQKQSELKVRESEERSRMLIEHAPVGISLLRDGLIIDANNVCLHMFGFEDARSLRGTPLGERIVPERRVETLERIVRCAQGQTDGTAYETTALRRDGSTFPCHVSVNSIVLSDGPLVIGFFVDMTERMRSEEQLLASERKYRELVANANSIILRWNSEGTIIFMNEFGLKFFGYSESELLSRNVIGSIVLETESSDRNLSSLMAEIAADPMKFQQNINENVRKNGERVWVSWTNRVVLNKQGSVKEILSIGSDITERIHAEDELKKYREHLEQLVSERTADLRKSQLALLNMVEDLNAKKEELAIAMEKAQVADQLKSAFLATMSHELRTPLNSIIGFTGILLQGLAGALNQEQQKQMSMVQNSARHLLALINDVLDISKIEAGELVLVPATFHLGKSLETMVKMVLPLAEKKGISVHLEVADTVGIITADQRRLEQVVLNLLNNAVKFTEKGHVSLSCRTAEGHYLLSFSDTGMGMKPEDIPNLFQPFRQIDSGLTRKHEGTGLGLSICKKIIDMMGGSIRVESEWGTGSVFTVSLPEKSGGVS